MNPQLHRLVEIAKKKERMIIGLMSGTSLDGLDVALCRFQGQGIKTRCRLERFETIPYDETTRNEIRRVFAKPTVEFQRLCMLHPWLGQEQGRLVLDCLDAWKISPREVDLIASHGQTVFHAPAWMHGQSKFGNSTMQIGDTDQMAVTTGIISIGDFRQKHIAAGGEGAPLAAYGDFLLYGSSEENRVLLNIGGIANFTFLPAGRDVTKLLSTDIGPGNTLIDAAMRKFFDQPYDHEGLIARQGTVSRELLSALHAHPFFNLPVPKTTGPELFNLGLLEEALQGTGIKTLSPADLVATLTAFSATCIVDAIKDLSGRTGSLNIYFSGGGMHNPVLTEMIRDALPVCRFDTTQALGIDPDAKEAVLFAVLANETVAGSADTFQGNGSGVPAVTMGKISFPG